MRKFIILLSLFIPCILFADIDGNRDQQTYELLKDTGGALTIETTNRENGDNTNRTLTYSTYVACSYFSINCLAGSFDPPQDSTNCALVNLYHYEWNGTSVAIPTLIYNTGDWQFAWSEDWIDSKYDGNGLTVYIDWTSTYTVVGTTCAWTFMYGKGTINSALSSKGSPITATSGVAYSVLTSTITLSSGEFAVLRNDFFRFGVTRDYEVNPTANINAQLHLLGVRINGRKSE